MRKTALFIAAVACLLISGCATRPVDSYTPQSSVRYEHGNPVSTSDFTYVPMTTKGLRSDQLENTAIGNFYLGISVADLVHKATERELASVGMVVKPDADMVVSGDVLEFKAADLGFTIDWTYAILYKISRRSTGETLFSSEYRAPMMNTRKLFASQASLVEFIHKMIAAGADMFVKDPKVREILDAPKAAN